MFFENYDPQRFASLYADVGPKLSQFFANPVVVALLKGSVKLRRPAVEAIEEHLLEYAKDDVKNQRVRQLVGHMIRHLMEELGYELDQPEVRLPSGVLFTCGARYRVAKNARRSRHRPCSGDSMTDAASDAWAQSAGPAPTIQALGSAYHAGCLALLRFVDDFVAPTVAQETVVTVGDKSYRHPFYFRLACGAMTERLHAWLQTLQKLSGPADFQAIVTAGRALFEMAVDLTLIKFEEGGSMGKMQAWHMDTKLRWAKQKVKNGLDKNGASAKFIADMGRQIDEMTDRYWGAPELKKTRKKDRWTGRDLFQDSTKAETYVPLGFVEYYAERYKIACWQVHGSGVIGVMEAPADTITFLAAGGLRDAERFATASCKLLIELLGKFDANAEARFEHLATTIAQAYADTLALHRKLAAS